MHYNTSRNDLLLPEYGRNIQNMVSHAVTLNNREERNSAARAIIEVIGNLNPHLRDNPDFRHKLWDHLFIMSDFQLDVDSPFPIPDKENFASKPEKVPYPRRSNKHRYYGNILKDMVRNVQNISDEEAKSRYIKNIANNMKKAYLAWNKDTVDDAVIIRELNELSGGKIDLSGEQLVSSGAYQPTFNKNKRPNNNPNKKFNKNKNFGKRNFKRPNSQ
jgi:hypothetical protein